MKKYIFGGIVILAITAATTFNISLASKTNSMPNVMLANVEALAQENTDCPGKHCSFTNNLGTCSTCCPLGKSAVCNEFGCRCE